MAQWIFHGQALISSYSQLVSWICILVMTRSSERASSGYSFGEWQGSNQTSVALLASLGTQVCWEAPAQHSLLVFVVPLVGASVVLEQQRFPFRAAFPALPGSIPLLLLQHKLLLRCFVLITFVYCTGNVLPKPRNKQGRKLNHLRADNVFCQLEL